MNGSIRVNDILKRPIFASAVVVAGLEGLSRMVRWVHILEVVEVRSLIHGGELVLTTGTAFQNRETVFNQYLQDLMEAGAVGLCIELGIIQSVPKSVIELANANAFPLVVFPAQVRFVDITQDVHSYILSQHHKLMDDLERITQNLQLVTFHEGAVRQILSILQKETGCSVLFGRIGQRPLMVESEFIHPDLGPDWANPFLAALDSETPPVFLPLPPEWKNPSKIIPAPSLIVQPLTVLGVRRGILVFVCAPSSASEYLLLLMDKALSALSQHEFHRIAVQERQLFFEQDMVEQLIHGVRQDRAYSVVENAGIRTSGSNEQTYYITAVFRANQYFYLDDGEWFHKRIQLASSFKQTLMKFFRKAYMSVQPNRITAVLELTKPSADLKSLLEKVLEQIQQTALLNLNQNAAVKIGVGRRVQKLSQIEQSYEDSVLALQIAEQSERFPIVLYDEAGIYRWISLLPHDARANRLVALDIGRLQQYDLLHQTELLRTLRTYLDFNQSKQKTADGLFIHRQTLYHRLEQIERLLGVDLQDAKMRLSLHISLYYNEFLNGNPS